MRLETEFGQITKRADFRVYFSVDDYDVLQMRLTKQDREILSAAAEDDAPISEKLRSLALLALRLEESKEEDDIPFLD